jgi:hypothetical protein
MSTKKVAVPGSRNRWTSPFAVEHLSLVPLIGAFGAVVSGVENGWAIAAILLSVAYLFVFVRSRHY